MEVFGRTIAVIVGMVGVVFLLLFSKTASVRWQQHETVRGMSNAFAEKVMYDRRISVDEWETFLTEVECCGGYRAKLTVYERRRYEDRDGSFYSYQRSDITEERILKEGSYVRIIVFPKEKKALLFGDYGIIVAGGCVQ